MPPISFKESEDDSDPYDAVNVLLYVKDKSRDVDTEVLLGWYEEEVLYPFPNIASFKTWNGHNIYDINDQFSEVTHWMPLPKPPEEDA